MRHICAFVTLAVLCASCGKIEKRIDDLEGRVASLEARCDRMNTDISSLQAIVNVLNQADFITAVTPVTDDGKVVGYKIDFRNNPSITIYYGADGKDGKDGKDGQDAAQLGVARDGEDWYWTLDGEWLIDENGERIRANSRDGVTPELKIEDGDWWISYDEGTTWERLQSTGVNVFSSVREDDNYVYITLTSGTEIKIPKVGSVIEFEDQTVKMLCVKNWDTNKDGELSFEEAASVKSIGTVFAGMGILYFNELAYFTGLEKIEDEAFIRSSLMEITLPESLKSIGFRSFFNTALKSIAVPESVTDLGRAAFYACRTMEHANIPNSITAIPDQLFAGCWKLQEINIPPALTKIGEEAFLECFEMADVTLPETVDSIGRAAFSKCQTFTEFVVPESVEYLGPSMFQLCTGLTSVKFPSTLKVLDHMVVNGCSSLETIEVPASVEQIGWYTFWDCTKLSTIIMNPVVPPVVRVDNYNAGNLFDGCKLYRYDMETEQYVPAMKIYVPDVAAYSNDSYWSKYSDLFVQL